VKYKYFMYDRVVLARERLLPYPLSEILVDGVWRETDAMDWDTKADAISEEKALAFEKDHMAMVEGRKKT